MSIEVAGKGGEEDGQGVEGYSHIFRRKTRRELVRISAAVMGIEFSYAAETAFVSPTLLKIGVEHQHMTLVWALSPLVGFFLTPILGSLSDKCPSRYGRRRPFIFFMSLGVLLGLLLVPNGESLGYLISDPRPIAESTTKERTVGVRLWSKDRLNNQTIINADVVPYNNSHPWGILFTVLGTVLLDFDADACQSPARAYLLDVTTAEDHARGLSTFTIMAGLGGFMGYALGGINWDATFIGDIFGGHVRAVFSLITIIFIFCVGYTITSFKEMPLHILESGTENLNLKDVVGVTNKSFDSEENLGKSGEPKKSYGSLNKDSSTDISPEKRFSLAPDANASLKIYLQSIVYMPHSIRMLCLTNLFCWMAHVCYSLYFTDFVGEAVFGGSPVAPEGTSLRELYESGVRFGCWGMSMYSLSCACYSSLIEMFISKFGAKKVYIGGLLTYSVGMLMMALTKNKVGVIVFSGTAGVMYSTLFTMPYLLVAHYHAKGVFEVNQQGEEQVSSQIRGLGTDVAIVSSMVFLAQFILSMCMGTIVSLTGTTTAVVSVATALAFFGAISATRVVYLDL
ncbi:proton-associated sugar transporter A isoform X2 [Anthonomus grandis grandis]|uniref:proton-associated sugar transporter A isoform X2 n=1 Tax=Anthonomus grandis grandis TaxID=2921223 RepID=UPI00216635E2|nr:proton-associated sugar transporter A isoform X2 [Anthonomus grandis grandis]